MLKITIPDTEMFDSSKGEFFTVKGQTLTLEHSLVSISKWESKWNKAFLSNKEKTTEETLDYIKCMTLTQNVDPKVYSMLTQRHIQEIYDYVNAPMTATTFREQKSKKANNEIVTSEIIYYWMIAMNIPMKCEKWHLNRLLTLIRVCSIKNGPQKKMSKREIMEQQRSLNEIRRKQLNSKG